MAFTPETGVGLAGANSYINVQQFKDHFNDRGKDVSAITDPQIQAAAIKASDYIDKRFGRRFLGLRKQKTQGLEWPRGDAWDLDGYILDGLPAQLVKACAEYALRAHTLGILAPDPALPFTTRDATGGAAVVTAGQVISKREKVGPIEEENKFADTSSSSNRVSTGSSLVDGLFIPPYPEADMWLEELLKSAVSRDVYRG